MAVGDRVTIFWGTQAVTTFAPAGPLFGTIIVEAGDPEIVTVLWDNGLVAANLVRDSVLLRIFSAEDDDPRLFSTIGKFQQVTDYPAANVFATTRPKDPAAAGVVHRAFSFPESFDDEEPLSAGVEMSWYDGRVRAFIPAPSDRLSDGRNLLNACLLEQPGRRLVGKF